MTSKKRIRYNLDLLITFCNSNKIKLSKDYRNENINSNTRIEGECINIGCSNEFNKKFIILCKTNGYCKGCTIRIGRNKAKATTLKKYGVENAMQSEEFQKKMKATNLKRHGVENPFQSEEVQKKMKAAILKRYGVEYAMQSEEVQKKMKATNLDKYGVEYAMQNAEISENASKNAYKGKEYTWPSGDIINIQGYENLALDDLLHL